jgi:hypothetical protein
MHLIFNSEKANYFSLMGLTRIRKISLSGKSAVNFCRRKHMLA